MIDASVYIRDTGFFVEIAKSLVGKFKTVYYSCPRESGYMHAYDEAVGSGIAGVTHIPNGEFWDYVANARKGVDLFYYPDCVFGDEQKMLRRMGHLVWGSAGTNWMEQDRFRMREWLEKEGMPVPATDEYTGIDELQENAKPEQYIKISKFRADMETVKHYDRARSEQRLNELRSRFGMLSREMQFLVEDKIEGIEIGYDGWNVEGKSPALGLWGIEIKDAGYLGKISRNESMPQAIRYVNEKVAKIFKEENYRGPYSNEIRVDKNRGAYLTDPTMREPNPPYQLKIEMYDNYAECIYEGAKGNLIAPKPKARYGAVAIINSSFAENNSVAIKIPKQNRQYVKILCLAERDGEAFALPLYHIDEIGAVIGMGDSPEAAVEQCKKHAEGIEGDQVDIEIDALDKAIDTFKEARRYGIEF